MTAAETMMPQNLAAQATWRTDCALAAVVALLALCLHALAGFPTLAASNGDNDSLLRLVEVRDLIGGQDWFDLHQYRMGPAGGFLMHWSRIVDVPIAAIILAVSAMTGSMTTGETAALIAWPTLLMAAALAFMLRIARAIGGEWALLPALTIGGAALHFGSIFVPGDIDHHNVQLTLTLAALTALVVGRGFVSGLAAGAACALMLSVGMETVPYVAVAGLTASAAYLLGGRAEAVKAVGFGTGFASTGAVAFVAIVPAGAWFAAQCDAYSIPQFIVALLAGAGLAAISAIAPLHATFARRLMALAVLGAATGAVVAIGFPQCLADPYAGLDPRLHKFWLRAITEAQPFWKVATRDWAMAVSYYVTPVLGLVVLGARLRHRGAAPAEWILAAFLITGFAVSLWQVRGATFSIPLAAIPLAASVGEWRQRTGSASGRSATLRMALAWMASLNIAWSAAANTASVVLGEPNSALAEPAKDTCDRPADYSALAAEPATTVLAISNLGAAILVNSRHRALAGPYHRNGEGNLVTLDAFMGTEAEARAIVNDNAVGLVAVCRGNGETAALARWAPQGFMAALVDGHMPDWLEKLPQASGDPLEVYRVRRKP